MIALLVFSLAAQASLPGAVASPGASRAFADRAVPPALPSATATSSTGFLLLPPRVHVVGDTVRLDGTVCRRPNRSLISPTRVQIDHLSAAGDLVDTSFAYLPSISQREDQRCAHYGAKLKTPPQNGDLVRVCLAQRKGACAAGK